MLLALLALVIWLSLSLVSTFATIWSLYYSHSSKRLPSWGQSPPPISLLKPLKGLEPGLERNLGSCFLLDYPRFEILFCVAHASDPVCDLVKKLIEFHPQVKARLIVGESEIGHNPKVNNLYQAYQSAQYNHLVISDSNVRVKPDYLHKMMAVCTDKVGVVTSLVSGIGFRGLGGYLEAAYLNAVLARMMPLGILMGIPLVIGKSMLFQRSDAEKFGGLKFLGKYLAEDYMTGYAMKKLGLRIALSTEPIRQYIGNRSFKSFWDRHVRWGRLRKAHSPFGFLFEPFTGAILPALIGAWSVNQLVDIAAWKVFIVSVFYWGMWDASLMSQNSKLSLKLFGAWWLREFLALPLWLHAALGRTVDWRGQKLKLKKGGELWI